MNKEQALAKISYVKSKRTDWQYVQEVLTRVEDYVKQQDTYSHQDTMSFINGQMSSKLGGVFAYGNKALDFLKHELKSEYKKTK
jgi:hypothetical protein